MIGNNSIFQDLERQFKVEGGERKTSSADASSIASTSSFLPESATTKSEMKNRKDGSRKRVLLDESRQTTKEDEPQSGGSLKVRRFYIRI